MPDVAMPRLSDSMEEGTILKWLKSDGDEVKKGEELVEIETDKANMTYEADQDGVLKIVASEGDTLPVGETIASIGEGSGGGDDSSGEPGEAASAGPDEADSDDTSGEDGSPGGGGDGGAVASDGEGSGGAGDPEKGGDEDRTPQSGGD